MSTPRDILDGGAFTRQQADALLRLFGLLASPQGVAEAIAEHVAEPDPHPVYLTKAEADVLYAPLP